MPLTRFLGDTSFGPDEIAVLVAAYKAAMRELDVPGPTAPGAETLAMTIIRLAKQSNPVEQRAVNAIPSRPGRLASRSIDLQTKHTNDVFVVQLTHAYRSRKAQHLSEFDSLHGRPRRLL